MSDEFVPDQFDKGDSPQGDSKDPSTNYIQGAQLREKVNDILGSLRNDIFTGLSNGVLKGSQDPATRETLARFPILSQLATAIEQQKNEKEILLRESLLISNLVRLATTKIGKEVINALEFSNLTAGLNGFVELNGEAIQFGNSEGSFLKEEDIQNIKELFKLNPTLPEALRKLYASNELLFDEKLSPSLSTLQEVLKAVLDTSKDTLSTTGFLSLAEDVKKGTFLNRNLSGDSKISIKTITISNREITYEAYIKYIDCFEFLKTRGLLDYLIDFLKSLVDGSYLRPEDVGKIDKYTELKRILLDTTGIQPNSNYPEVFEDAYLLRATFTVENSIKTPVSDVLRRLALSIKDLKLQKFIQEGGVQSLDEDALIDLISKNVDLSALSGRSPILLREWEVLLQDSTALLLSQGLRTAPLTFLRKVRLEQEKEGKSETERLLREFKPLENELKVLEYRDGLNGCKKLALKNLLESVRRGVLSPEISTSRELADKILSNFVKILKEEYSDFQTGSELEQEFVQPIQRLIAPAFELAFYNSVERVRENFGKSDTGTGDGTQVGDTLQRIELLKVKAAGDSKLLEMVEELKKSYERYLFGNKPRESFRYIRERFQYSLYPLVFSLISDPSKNALIKKYIAKYTDSSGEVNPNLVYRLYLTEFLSQRSLTAEEVQYLRSVEVASVFNPYLVAAMACFPNETSAFLKNHFKEVSGGIAERIRDGDYVPTLVVGLGVSGAVTAGEIARLNPSNAGSVLYVDSKALPGGPFETGGKSWRLNSANPTKPRKMGRVLPPSDKNFYAFRGPTVRSKAPLSWYPGERGRGRINYLPTRAGEINPVVPFLPELGEISDGQRYPTNDQLALLIQSHVAMCAKNVLLETKVIKIEPTDDPLNGSKLVTLEIKQGDKTRTVEIYTDSLIVGTGPGVPNFGFDIEKSSVYQLTKPTKERPFPRITTTLEAFKLFNNLKEKGSDFGGTIVIYGFGNSADVLLEYFGKIFESGNSLLNNITKIYVIGEGSLSQRPRYASTSDLLSRDNPNGVTPNLVELVQGRVSDIEESSTGTLLLSGKDGFILDSEGHEIEADYVISAAGFRPELAPLLEGYASRLSQISQNNQEKKPLYSPLNLPGTSVKVGEYLSLDPTVLVVGTAAVPDFGDEKLSQLPPLSKEALQRVGATNAVAIGFRTPETLAAVDLWIANYIAERPLNLRTSTSPGIRTTNIGENAESGIFSTKIPISEEDLSAVGLEDVPTMMTSIFQHNLGNNTRFFSYTSFGEIKYFEGNLKFGLSYNEGDNCFEFKYISCSKDYGAGSIICKEVVNVLKNPDFQKYLLKHFKNMRMLKPVNVELFFKAGYPDPRRTIFN